MVESLRAFLSRQGVGMSIEMRQQNSIASDLCVQCRRPRSSAGCLARIKPQTARTYEISKTHSNYRIYPWIRRQAHIDLVKTRESRRQTRVEDPVGRNINTVDLDSKAAIRR